MKVIYMKPTLDMIAGQYPEAIESLVISGTVKVLNEEPYLVLDIPEEVKKPRRNANKNKE